MVRRIRQERIRRGLTQEKVACELGITQSMLQKTEIGTRTPSYAVLVKLGDYFNQDFRKLMEFVPESDSETA